MPFPLHINIVDLVFKGMLIGMVASAPMGPVGILCVQRTLNKGRWYGFVTGIGAAVSDIIYAGITGFGMAFVMDFINNEQNKFYLQIIGSAVTPTQITTTTFNSWDVANRVQIPYDETNQYWELSRIHLTKDKLMRFLVNNSLATNFGEDTNFPGDGIDTWNNNYVTYESSASSGTNISNGWSGMTKANWANSAMKRKIISGLENVTRNAVQVLYQNVPCCLPD